MTRHQRMKKPLRSTVRRRRVWKRGKKVLATWRADPRWAPPLGTAPEEARLALASLRHELPGLAVNQPKDLVKISGPL